MTSSSLSRRGFLRRGTFAAGALSAPNLLLGQATKPKRIQFASVGAGGQAASDIGSMSEAARMVACCDVDRDRLAGTLAKYPEAKGFGSFREMLEAMGDKVDCVIVATPDHTHFPAAMEAIKRRKHVIVQKPLVNRLWEADQLLLAARKKGVKTNMGNQGHTGEGIRRLKEWVEAGIVGRVKEIEVWTDRPIWPQGQAAAGGMKAGQAPANLDWKEWLSQCPDIPFTSGLHPFVWRGHFEYGSGALGDIGCHALDAPFFACGLGEPYAVDAEVAEPTASIWPKSARVEMRFKTKLFGEVKVTWYDGGRKPERPASLDANADWDGMSNGNILRGEEGELVNFSVERVLADGRFADWRKTKMPPARLEPSLAPGNPQAELVKAIEQDKICGSNFEHSVPLTRLCLIGNLAVACPGQVLEWDAAAHAVKGNAEANRWLRRAAVRPGWEYSAAGV